MMLFCYSVKVCFVIGTHDGHILVFHIPSNERNIFLRETVNGITNFTVLIVIAIYVIHISVIIPEYERKGFESQATYSSVEDTDLR